MSQNLTSKSPRPISASKRRQQITMRVGAGLAGLSLIILGSTNLALNGMTFFKQGPNELWIAALPFVALFAVAPLLFGIWLLNRAMVK